MRTGRKIPQCGLALALQVIPDASTAAELRHSCCPARCERAGSSFRIAPLLNRWVLAARVAARARSSRRILLVGDTKLPARRTRGQAIRRLANPSSDSNTMPPYIDAPRQGPDAPRSRQPAPGHAGRRLGVLRCRFAIPSSAIAPDRPLTQSLQRIWQTQQGLPSSPDHEHPAIAHDGCYLWLGTQKKGLFRFDGMHFTAPLTAPPNNSAAALDDLWIQDLYEDAQLNLWIATDGAGLIRLRDGNAERYKLAQGLPSEDVRSVVADSQGVVWVATAGGLARLTEPSSTDSQSFELCSRGNLRALCATPSGQLWAGGDGNQLTAWNGQEISTRQIESLPAHGSVRALLCAGETIWIGTSDGLVRLKGWRRAPLHHGRRPG